MRIFHENNSRIFFSSHQTSTPLFKRHSSKNKFLPLEPIISPTRNSRQSHEGLIPIRAGNKRKYSTNSLSPISTTSSNVIKKRAKHGSPLNKIKSKKYQSDGEQSDNENHIKRKRKFDLSSTFLFLTFPSVLFSI